MSNKGFQTGSSNRLGLRTQTFGVVGLYICTVKKSGPIHMDQGMSAPNLSANSRDEVQLCAHPSFWMELACDIHIWQSLPGR